MPTRRSDITNQRFGLLVAKLPAYTDKHGWYWVCQCDCGTVLELRASNLLAGQAKSCGCNQHPKAEKKKAHDPTYRTWSMMITRCYNPHATGFENWGGRGITVCDRWRFSYLNFLDDMGPRPKGTSLDRINNDGNYEPRNCRWATPAVQIYNRRPPKGFKPRTKMSKNIPNNPNQHKLDV